MLNLQLLIYTTQAVKTLDEVDGEAPGVWTQSYLESSVAQKTFHQMKGKELYNIFWLYDTDKEGKNRNFRVYQTSLLEPAKKVVYNAPKSPVNGVYNKPVIKKKQAIAQDALAEILGEDEPPTEGATEWGNFYYEFLSLSMWKDIPGQFKASLYMFNQNSTIQHWQKHPLDPRLWGIVDFEQPGQFKENNWYLWLESKKAYQSITKQQLKALGYDFNLLCKPEQAVAT